MAPIDRLSGLPDDVIIHILSFLQTKISASTDVLARRWRFLWTHVPNLFFDEECQDPAVIDRVIGLHRAKTMNTLSLDIYNCRQDQLATWITHALNRGVRNLYLDVGDNRTSTFTLPEYFFTCKTLVDVSLYECRGISSRDKVFLPSLKKLFLSRIRCDDDETLPTLPHLISGCPVLQDLIIEGYYGLNCVLVVSSLTIKYLEVDLDVVIDECDLVVLKINAPSLQYLKVRNFYSENITISTTMTSLIEAHISSVEICHGENEFSAARFLNCLCNSEYLSISIDEECDQVVNIVGLDSMVKFHNLTKLELRLMFDFHELVEFLEAVDNLKHLKFTLGRNPNMYREPKRVPMCMLSSLKTIRINSSECFNTHDIESIIYILKNAQVMERMEIHPYRFNRKVREEELEMLGRIPLLERGSQSCQIVFC